MAKKKEVKIVEKVEVIEPKKEVAKKEKKPNQWLIHVKKYREEHPDTPYKECLQKAKLTYKKGGAIKEDTHTMPDGKEMKGSTHEVEPDVAPVPEKKMKKVKKVKAVKTMR